MTRLMLVLLAGISALVEPLEPHHQAPPAHRLDERWLLYQEDEDEPHWQEKRDLAPPPQPHIDIVTRTQRANRQYDVPQIGQ